jgi:uncharacterized protein YhaN
VKILQLDLRAFGPFTGRSLDLSEGDAGLHVVYGPNEAGKSSALRAIDQMLFGIPARPSDDFIHSYKNLRVGARLSRASGPPLEFLRRKGTGNTLLEADNETPLPEDALRPLLGALDRELFRTMFGIDHQQLIQGGKEIVHGSGNVGQLLFAAGAGIADLQAVQARLESEAEELFTRRAHTRKINQTLKALDTARKRARQTQLPGEEWAQHDEAFRAAMRQRDAVQQQLQHCQREQSRLSRIRQAHPILAKHRELFQQRQALGNVKILPADFPEQRRTAITDMELARNDAQKARDELQRIERQLESIAVPTTLLAKAAQIKELPDTLGSHRKAQRDLPGLRARRELLLQTAAEILRQIRPELSLEMVEPLRLTTLQRAAIADLGNRHAALVQNLEQSQQEIHDAGAQLAAEQTQLADLESPRPAGPLKDAMRRVQSQGNLQQQAADVRAELAGRQQQAAVDVGRLPYWSGTLDELEKLPVPAAETIDRFEKDLGKAEQQCELLRVRLDESANARADAERQLDESRREGEVPGEDDLAAARRLRDQGWQLVLEAWRQGAANHERLAEFLAAFAPDLDLAAAYAQAVGRADQCADRLRREAGRVATRAGLLARREALERQIAAITQQADEARAAQIALEQAWQAPWLAVAIQPGRPREMRAWLQRQQALLEEAAAIRVRRSEAQRLDDCTEAARQQLRDALAALAAPPADGEPQLAAMLDHCQAVVDRIEASETQRQQLQKSIRQLAQRLSAAEGRAERAAAEIAQWRARWALAIEPLGLPAETIPAAANQVVTQTAEMFARLAEIRDLDERIQAILSDAALFQRQVDELSAALAPELAGQDVAAAAEALITLCNQAATAQNEQQNLRKHEQRHQAALVKAQQTIEGLAARLRTMCQEAFCQRAEDLPEAERVSQTACRLDEQLAALEEQLLTLSAGVGIDALRAEAETINADELPATLEQWTRQLEQLESERSQLDQTIGEERNTLATMLSGAEAPEAAEEVQELLAELDTDVRQYVRLRMASAILRDGIERYRQKNEGPVLRRASELFQRLTLGSFERLSADCDDRGEKVLKGVRPGGGGAVDLAGMSEGTSDQLYLALRLASLESYLIGREPIPFIVDDVLVTFDDSRAVAALQALGELSRRTQIIFFTHHQHLVQLAGETLDAGVLFVHAL